MCQYAGCTAPLYNPHSRWCLMHRDVCQVEGCAGSADGKVMCPKHSHRQRLFGTTEDHPRRQPQRTRPYQINLLLSKGEKHYTQGEAEAVGMSMAQYLRLLLQNDMSKQGRN